MLLRTAGALLSRTYNRYLIASVIALGVDTGLFLLLVGAGMIPLLASAVGYVCGIVVHWLVSTRFVFDLQVASAGVDRVRQKSLFVVTALMGLAITMAIVGLAHRAGLHPLVGKMLAVAISFQTTYFARRAMVFRG